MTHYMGYDADAERRKQQEQAKQHTPARGGDMTFQAGKGFAGGADGEFKFLLGNGEEALRIDPNGCFWVNGEVAQTDRLVYEAFRLWVARACATLSGNSTFQITKDGKA
jgi:hypothetical protein